MADALIEPLRGAFREEGVDAFAGIGELDVIDHGLAGCGVGSGAGEGELFIKSPFAECECRSCG